MGRPGWGKVLFLGKRKGKNMCRILIADCRVAERKFSSVDIANSMESLRKSQGGDGDGILTWRKRSGWKCTKGNGIGLAKLAREAYECGRAGGVWVYHTRRVSVGWVEDSQCHPHRASGRKFRGWIVHNGTWTTGRDLAVYLGLGSDSQALARVLGKFGIDGARAVSLFPTGGVVVCAEDAHPELRVIVNRNADMGFGYGNHAAGLPLVWASEQVSIQIDAHDVRDGDHISSVAPPKHRQASKESCERDLILRRFSDPLYNWVGG